VGQNIFVPFTFCGNLSLRDKASRKDEQPRQKRWRQWLNSSPYLGEDLQSALLALPVQIDFTSQVLSIGIPIKHFCRILRGLSGTRTAMGLPSGLIRVAVSPGKSF
jgi:hypothetical protein